MRSLLVRLYPSSWHERYGDEFASVLEERPLGPFDVADVFLGALDAHLRLRGRRGFNAHERGTTMSLRIGGVAALAGVAFFVTGLLLWSVRPAPLGEAGPSILLVFGSTSLLVALAGLSAFQARSHPVLTWSAFGVASIGTIAFVVGFIGSTRMTGNGDGDDAYWGIWFLGLLTAVVGSALFAIATYRTAALSRRAAALLGLGCLLMPLNANIQAVMLLAIALFFVGWTALGIHAIRLDRSAVARQPT